MYANIEEEAIDFIFRQGFEFYKDRLGLWKVFAL